MNRIRITNYQSGQEEMIFQLIKKVYDEFVAIDYIEEGNRFFYDWIQPSHIAHRQLNRNNIWVAFKDAELVGMIEIRDNKYISLLFVDKAYYGQGIAKKLVNEALKEVLQRDPTLDKSFMPHPGQFRYTGNWNSLKQTRFLRRMGLGICRWK